jgi:hypothetical protein
MGEGEGSREKEGEEAIFVKKHDEMSLWEMDSSRWWESVTREKNSRNVVLIHQCTVFVYLYEFIRITVHALVSICYGVRLEQGFEKPSTILRACYANIIELDRKGNKFSTDCTY